MTSSVLTNSGATSSPGPLAGYRVVEVTVWVAGPGAGAMLADWGADVIKVEGPAGDPQRRIFTAAGGAEQPINPPFEVDNRGKRSVVLDLHLDADCEQMHALLDTADVLLTNLRPTALEGFGLGHEAVLTRHPTLVYAQLTGYGMAGDDRDRPGYDYGAFWARSGVAHTAGPMGELLSAKPPGAMGDHTTALSMAAGILAKLLERHRTGVGGLVATSLLRTGMYVLAQDLATSIRFGKRSRTRPRAADLAPQMNLYAAGEGRGFWLLGMEGDRHWPSLVAAMGDPAWCADERFATARSRTVHAEATIAALDATFATADLAAWAERFEAHGVWWAPIQSIFEVIDDPQAADGFVEMADGNPTVATPVDFGAPLRHVGRAPALGEHTTDVLNELGIRPN